MKIQMAETLVFFQHYLYSTANEDASSDNKAYLPCGIRFH